MSRIELLGDENKIEVRRRVQQFFCSFTVVTIFHFGIEEKKIDPMHGVNIVCNSLYCVFMNE
jgi:hypothetical protein